MTEKKFLTSVADAYIYDSSDNLLATGKTLLDSSIEVTLSNKEVRGGRGNQLQYNYFQTAAMNITINDTQWNLAFIALNGGVDVVTGTNIYAEETVTLTSGGAGVVVGTPIAIQGTTIYGWVTLENGNVERVTFSGKNFTASGGTSGDVVCVRYFNTNSAARSVTINANIIPKIARIVLDAQLASSDVSTNVIGKVEIIIPKAQISGAFSIAMTPDGVASTPLKASALAYSQTSTASCSNVPVYAEIIETIDSAHWYDNLIGIAIAGGDFALGVAATKTIRVYAVPVTGAAFPAPVADLTFSSSDTGKATIDSAGLVTGVAAGTTTIKATITAAPSYDSNLICTVS